MAITLPVREGILFRHCAAAAGAPAPRMPWLLEPIGCQSICIKACVEIIRRQLLHVIAFSVHTLSISHSTLGALVRNSRQV